MNHDDIYTRYLAAARAEQPNQPKRQADPTVTTLRDVRPQQPKPQQRRSNLPYFGFQSFAI